MVPGGPVTSSRSSPSPGSTVTSANVAASRAQAMGSPVTRANISFLQVPSGAIAITRRAFPVPGLLRLSWNKIRSRTAQFAKPSTSITAQMADD